MIKRIITGLGLVGIVLMAALWWRQSSVVFVDMIVLVFTYLGAFELFRSLKKGGFEPMWIPLMIFVVILYPLFFFWREIGIVFALVVAMIASAINFTFDHSKKLPDLFATILIAVYPMTIMSLLLAMNHSVGELLGIFLVFAIAVGADTGAYFVGVTFKGKKLCPSISPKKTISGAIGGVFGGMIGAGVIFLLFDFFRVFDSMGNMNVFYLFDNWKISLPVYLGIGAAGAVLCELGDLSASWIKRQVGIKDFGSIFPGHGGFMDRIDGIMFVIPVVYFVVRVIFHAS